MDGLKAWSVSGRSAIGSGGSPLWPVLSRVSPFPVPASASRQWLTLDGSGFTAGSQVFLHSGSMTFTVPPDRMAWVSSRQLRVFATVTDEPAEWTAQVVTPEGGASGLLVIRPARTGFTSGDEVRVAGTGGLGLRLRAAPTLAAVILRVMPEGAMATVLDGPVSSDGHAWWRLNVGGVEGWAAGGYLLRGEAGGNQPPSIPVGLTQLNPATGVPLPADAQITGTAVTFAATVSDPDEHRVRLQVELRRHDESWTGTPTYTSPLVASGSQVTVASSSLGTGRYKWRARAVDERGVPGIWEAFAGAEVAFVLNASRLPAATFAFDPATPVSGQPVTFAYAGESAPGQTYAWDFGDGSPRNGDRVVQTFAQSGVYRVTLTVRRADGATVRGERDVPVGSSEILAAVDRLHEGVHVQLDGILETARSLADVTDQYFGGITSAHPKMMLGLALQVIFSAAGNSLPDLPLAKDAAVATVLGLGEEAVNDAAGFLLSKLTAPQQSFRRIFIPGLEQKVGVAKQELGLLRNEALASSANLSPDQIAALVRDLNARRGGNLQRLSLYQQQAHLPVTFAELRAIDLGSTSYTWARYLLAGSLGLLDFATTVGSAGTSKVLLFSLFATVGVNQNIAGNLQSLSVDERMFASSLTGLGEGTLAMEDIRRNARDGLDRVKAGSRPPRVTGELTVTHRTEGSVRLLGQGPSWNPDKAYSRAVYRNNGEIPAQFVVSAVFPVRITTTDIFPWIPTGGIGARRYDIHTVSASDPIWLNPGESASFDFEYIRNGVGGTIPKDLIVFTLIAKSSDGLYLLNSSMSRFGTTFLEGGRVLPVEETEELRLLPWRFQAVAEPLTAAGDFRISLRLHNPEAAPARINLTQALPPGAELTRVISHEGIALDWEADIEPESSRQVEFEVRLLPGVDQVTLPGAALSLYDPILETWVPFTLNEVTLSRLVQDSGLLDAISEAAGNAADHIGVLELATLGSVRAGGRSITNLAGLQLAWLAEEIHLNDNGIEDLGPLASLYKVRTLNLAGNRIMDLGPLVELARNGGLGEGAMVDLRDNPLVLTPGTAVHAQYEELIHSGVEVLVGNESGKMTFATWMETRQVPLELRSPGADASGDGVPNLLAYFFNIDPLNGRDPNDPAALLRAEYETAGTRTYLHLFHRVNRRATGLTVSVMGSEADVAGLWRVLTPENTDVATVDPVTGDPLYRVTIDVTGIPERFVHLRVALGE